MEGSTTDEAQNRRPGTHGLDAIHDASLGDLNPEQVNKPLKLAHARVLVNPISEWRTIIALCVYVPPQHLSTRIYWVDSEINSMATPTWLAWNSDSERTEGSGLHICTLRCSKYSTNKVALPTDRLRYAIARGLTPSGNSLSLSSNVRGTTAFHVSVQRRVTQSHSLNREYGRPFYPDMMSHDAPDGNFRFLDIDNMALANAILVRRSRVAFSECSITGASYPWRKALGGDEPKAKSTPSINGGRRRRNHSKSACALLVLLSGTPVLALASAAERALRIASGVTASGAAVVVIPLRTIDDVPSWAWISDYAVWMMCFIPYLALQIRYIGHHNSHLRQLSLFLVILLATYFAISLAQNSPTPIDGFTIFGPIVLSVTTFLVALLFDAIAAWEARGGDATAEAHHPAGIAMAALGVVP
ncbi:hypothetical protein NCS57_01269400 [Fusarium keratoplasticum]|uniref:Uncharacterized protein n=1 Tax=Fusarium keratoplasticum TaxID=1328300 RepID=A0ACC0QLM3_9HYPO|nr:hypothetical protein NCS57_01269400 [Fusarium keratoplasticum]KAI8655211.1 hypothetical protein NCS57_01269400 [Fusarium keratoplasticum]